MTTLAKVERVVAVAPKLYEGTARDAYRKSTVLLSAQCSRVISGADSSKRLTIKERVAAPNPE